MSDLKDALGQAINNALQTFMTGARTDIAHYAAAISQDLVDIMEQDDPTVREALVSTLRDQVKMLAELHRVKATAAQWQTAHAIINGVLTVGMASLGVPTQPE